MKHFIVVIFFLSDHILTITSGRHLNACECVGCQHPQVKFNAAEWAIRGRIIEKDYFQCFGDNYGFPTDPDHKEDDIRYTVVVEAVFKGDISTTCKLTIVTAATTDRCGVPDLEIGETYFLSGKIQDGDKVIDNCDWVALWADVTPHQKNSIGESRRYADNEMCQSQCPFRREDKLECYYKFATCVEKIKQVVVPDTYSETYYGGSYPEPTVYETEKVCNWVVGYSFEPCLNPPTGTDASSTITSWTGWSGTWYI